MKFEELFKPKPGSLAAEMQKTIDGLNQEINELRAHAERVGQANDRLAVENAALRATAVEACALARVWVTVWGDKLSAESIKRLGELEKQILKEAKP